MAKWIQDAISEKTKGSFTAKAKKAGVGVQQFAKKKAKAPGKLGKQARLAMTFKKMGKTKKKTKKAQPGMMAGMLQNTFMKKGY